MRLRHRTFLPQKEKLDNYEDKLGTFLVKLSGTELSERDANEVSKLLHSLSDFERIGDHALSITYVAKEMHEKNIHFSPEAMKELNVLKMLCTKLSNLLVKRSKLAI